MSSIILIGFMGAGKTTIGRLLSETMNKQQVDLDDIIVERIGCSIPDYFETKGEAGFREIEEEVLKEAIACDHIVSTGGGIVLMENNRKLLSRSEGLVIYLQTEPDVFLKRIAEDDASTRPMASSKTDEEIIAVYNPRIALYEECATHIVSTDATPEQIVNEIVNIATT